MPWSSAPQWRRLGKALPGFVLLLAVMGASDERRLTVYSNAANYSLLVQASNGTDYVGLLEVLEPLGTVSAKASGPRWKFRYNDVEGEFSTGKTRCKVNGTEIDLPAPFLLESGVGRGLVSVPSLSVLLPKFLGGPVTLHEASRRLFIGNTGVHFTAQIAHTNPPTLVMNFTSPVNPVLANEPGRVRMTFTREPLVSPGAQALTFDNKAIPSASYQEANGTAEIVVTGNVPLIARFSNDNKTITLSPPQTAAQPAQPTPAPARAQASAPATPAAAAGNGTRRYFAVIDPGHGGEERGAALSDPLLEKEVTLSFARHLRQELENRHLETLLLRDGDTTVTLDQRANLANAAHPAIYICIHASSQGPGLRIFTALLQSTPDNRGPFLDWNTAQSSFLATSQRIADVLVSALAESRVPARTMSAPLRPLNNIEAPAMAIEISPSSENLSQVGSPVYQEAIASVIANGLAASRSQLEAGK